MQPLVLCFYAVSLFTKLSNTMLTFHTSFKRFEDINTAQNILFIFKMQVILCSTELVCGAIDWSTGVTQTEIFNV